MIKITRQDLRKKSNGQLTALFNQVSKNLNRSARLSQIFGSLQAALKLITDELSRRTPSP